MPDSKPGLTPRHEAFVNAYVATSDMVAAYRAAGYKACGHSAEVAASRLLRKVEIQRAIEERTRELNKRAMDELHLDWMTAWEIRRAIAFQDPADLFDRATNKLKPIEEIPERARRAIASMKVGKNGSFAIRMRDPDPHLCALEEKYGSLPDLEKLLAENDIGETRQFNTVEECDTALRAMLDQLRERQRATGNQVDKQSEK